MPVGPGDHFIFPVQRRQLHSVRSATFECRLDRQRIRTLVEERGVVAPSRFSDRRVYFSVEAADEILADAVGNMTTVEVAAVLGTHDDRVRDLIDRGHIVASERGANSDRPFYRIGKADLDDFRERLFRQALIARGAHGLVSLAAAAQQGSVTQSDVIGMILDGKLANVARTDASMTLGSLLVDLQQVIASVERPLRDESGTPLYLNLAEVERALSTTTGHRHGPRKERSAACRGEDESENAATATLRPSGVDRYVPRQPQVFAPDRPRLAAQHRGDEGRTRPERHETDFRDLGEDCPVLPKGRLGSGRAAAANLLGLSLNIPPLGPQSRAFFCASGVPESSWRHTCEIRRDITS